MNGSLAIIAALALQAASPDLTSIIAAWKDNASRVTSAAVELDVVRDSRDANFGRIKSSEDRLVVSLRFDDSLRRLDVPRLTATRRDDRTQPAESDPARARTEFRNVLLEEQLAGPQMVPRIEPATLFIDSTGQERGQKLSTLDRVLAEAPLWSARTLWLAQERQLAVMSAAVADPQDGVIRIVEKRRADRETELWVEPQPPHRPLRVIHREGKRPVVQVDLTYLPVELRFPARYFVQIIGPAGEALEFVEGSLGRVESLSSPLVSSPLAQLGRPNTDEPRLPNPSSIQMRSSIRRALDSNWFPALAIALFTLFVFLRRSLRRVPVS